MGVEGRYMIRLGRLNNQAQTPNAQWVKVVFKVELHSLSEDPTRWYYLGFRFRVWGLA